VPPGNRFLGRETGATRSRSDNVDAAAKEAAVVELSAAPKDSAAGCLMGSRVAALGASDCAQASRQATRRIDADAGKIRPSQDEVACAQKPERLCNWFTSGGIGSGMVAELPWTGYAFLLTSARLSPTTKSAFFPLGLCPRGAVL
jgi:hypothetical protein